MDGVNPIRSDDDSAPHHRWAKSSNSAKKGYSLLVLEGRSTDSLNLVVGHSVVCCVGVERRGKEGQASGCGGDPGGASGRSRSIGLSRQPTPPRAPTHPSCLANLRLNHESSGVAQQGNLPPPLSILARLAFATHASSQLQSSECACMEGFLAAPCTSGPSGRTSLRRPSQAGLGLDAAGGGRGEAGQCMSLAE